MPRKTRKQKQLAHTRAAQLPKRTEAQMYEQLVATPQVSIENSKEDNSQQVFVKKEQIPLVPHQKIVSAPTAFSPEATTHFRQDIMKTAGLTGLIVVIEVVLYQLMQSGMLEKWIPALKL